MPDHRTSHRGYRHPVGPVAVFGPGAGQSCAVEPPGVKPRERHLLWTTAGPMDVPEHRTPPLPAGGGSNDRTAQVSLLAATALGLALSSGAADGNVRTLTSLGGPDADILLEASAAVLELEVGPRRTRVLAADLLERAARICA
jgi:hypothetical protein